MWGYTTKIGVNPARIRQYILFIVFILAVLFMMYKCPSLIDKQVGFPIITASLGALITLESVRLQTTLALRKKLETKAITEITNALDKFQSASAISVTFNNDFVVIPSTISAGFWAQKANEKYDEIQKHMLDMRKSNGLYTAIESNELAVINLEQYYRYVTIQIDKFFKQADKLLEEFIYETSRWDLSHEEYKTAVGKFDALRDAWADLAANFIDLRKLLQNEMLGEVFGRKLLRRRPKPGFGTTLDKVATRAYVERLIKEQEADINSGDEN